MLHQARVLRAVYCNARGQIRKALRLRGRPDNVPVLASGFDHALERHRDICCLLRDHLAKLIEIPNLTICEIGCGDCLASADFFLGSGAAHVYLVDSRPIPINETQIAIIDAIKNDPVFPNRGDVLTTGSQRKLNGDKVTAWVGLLEDQKAGARVDVIFSNCVLEHVEDLLAFFSTCHELLTPSGLMVHRFDLSGHGLLEDPIPPLDFQTYSEFIYGLMYPKYARATRRFLPEYRESLRSAGFRLKSCDILLRADPAYMQVIRPELRQATRNISVDDLSALDVLLVAEKIDSWCPESHQAE